MNVNDAALTELAAAQSGSMVADTAHTLTPEFRLSGGTSASGIVDRLCVVAEANTK